MKHLLSFFSFLILSLHLFASAADSFDWKKATVYFVITDRFCNGDSLNDVNYGRKTDYGSERMNAATFHGGDFKGMLAKAREGYFSRLGVDVVWMTDVYEQIHGWMSGSGAVNDFPHYGYHGYYPLDYTQTDKNYGTIEELRELIDTLHSQGIRVMLGANLNDPGYPTLLDAVQYGFAPTGLTAAEAAEHRRDWSYDRFFEGRLGWNGWYDRGWIRMPDENWDENNPLEATLYGMPDFKDESNEPVRIPAFLKKKWKSEKKANDPWVNPSARALRTDREWSPAQYVTAWIASWVEEFGIDGFRCDIVENVRLNRWKELSEACNAALARWRAAHPADMANMTDCATTLLLAPGVAQIFYGDESRRPLSDARLNVDSDQAFRSDMNWATADSTLLDHFRRLGTIRRAHRAIGSGRQQTIDAHTCLRTAQSDTVIIAVALSDGQAVNVGAAFADGTGVTNLYTGEKTTVARGKASFSAYPNRLAVIAKE